MSHIEQVTINPFSAIRAPSLPDITNNLFAAYQKANNLETDHVAQQVGQHFGAITPQSESKAIYKNTHAFDESLGKIGDDGIHHVNTYFQLAAAAQKIRRQFVRKQLESNLNDQLNKRLSAEVSTDTPLPYGAYIPGGFAEWFFPHIDRHGKVREALFDSAEMAVDTIAQVVPEYVMTQHPYNSNPAAFNRTHAKIVHAALEVTMPSGGQSAQQTSALLTDALREAYKIPRIPNGRFTVGDEVSLSNNASRNFLGGRDQAFEEILRLMKIRFGANFGPELQLRLAKSFHVREGDWSGSDDDGNDNIKSEHRLSKLASQRLGMARRVADFYESLASDGHVFAGQRAQQLRHIETALLHICREINKPVEEGGYKLPDGDIAIPTKKWFEFAQEIQQVCVNVTGKTYKQYAVELQQEAENTFTADPGHNQRMLVLINALENSGLYGYHSELRKNIRFNNAALGELIKRIPELKDVDILSKDFDENVRLEIFDSLITNRQKLQHAGMRVVSDAEPNVIKNREFENNPLVMADHTVRSLALTQIHPDCYDNFVLAETGQASNMLGAVALQVAGQWPNLVAEPHWLHTIPLFEDANTLQHFSTIEQKALSKPAYQAVLFHLAEQSIASSSIPVTINHDHMGRVITPLTQKNMYAHSDSNRLMGRIAADGYLAMAHLSIWGTSQLDGYIIKQDAKIGRLEIEPYQGLSLSDPSRSGSRDQVGMIVRRSDAKHPKITVQSFDQANNINSEDEAESMIEKDITKAVKVIIRGGNAPRYDEKREMMVAQAAMETKDPYVAEHFTKFIPAMLQHPFWNYELHGYTNFSSRKSSRNKRAANPWVKNPDRPELEGSRAISVSTALHYAGIVLTHSAARHYEANLARAVSGSIEFLNELAPGTEAVTEGGISLSIASAQNFHVTAHEFGRNIDKSTYGVSETDYEVNHLRQQYGSSRGIPAVAISEAEMGQRYDEYIRAGKLGAKVFLGQDIPIPENLSMLEQCSFVRKFTREKVLPMDDRDYLSNLGVGIFAFHDRTIGDTLDALESSGKKDPPPKVVGELRMLDSAMNRNRSKTLDANGIALAQIVRGAQIVPAPKFAELVS